MKFIAAVLAIATAANAIQLQAQSDEDLEALKVLIPDILAKREAVDEALSDVLGKIQNICGCDSDDEDCIEACNADQCGPHDQSCVAIKDLPLVDDKDSDDEGTVIKDLCRVGDKDCDPDDSVVAIKDLCDLDDKDCDPDDSVTAIKDLPLVDDKDSDDDFVAIKDLPSIDEKDDDVIVIKDLQRIKE